MAQKVLQFDLTIHPNKKKKGPEFLQGPSSGGFSLYEEWVGTNTASTAALGWETSGSLSRTTVNSTPHVGVMQMTVNSGPAMLRLVSISQLDFDFVDSVYFETLMNLANLSDETQGYILRVGMGNSTSGSTDHNNGLYFEYNISVSNNWFACTANGGERTKVDTGILVQADWVKLSFGWDGTSANFSVNDGPITSILSTIPFGSFSGLASYGIQRTVGTSGRLFAFDYYALKVLMNRVP